MDKIMLYSRFNPLKRVLCYDIFDRGFNGWMVLLPNFTRFNVGYLLAQALYTSSGKSLLYATSSRLYGPRH